MLKQRIITALVLLAILLPALFADSPQPFLLLSILMIGAGAWEWGNMNGMSSRQSILSGVICVDLCILRGGLVGPPARMLGYGGWRVPVGSA